MSSRIIFFLFIIVSPYFVEQYAYSRFIPGPHKATENRATTSQSYGWRLIWDAAYFLLFINSAYRIVVLNAPWFMHEWLGYVCFLFGIALRVWSLKEIGRFYDPGIVIKSDHQMIRTGPYRALRHPLHLGTLLQITGLAGFAPWWLAFPAVLAALLLCLYLNRTEDRAHRQLGAAFESYYLNTWDLIDLIFWK